MMDRQNWFVIPGAVLALIFARIVLWWLLPGTMGSVMMVALGVFAVLFVFLRNVDVPAPWWPRIATGVLIIMVLVWVWHLLGGFYPQTGEALKMRRVQTDAVIAKALVPSSGVGATTGSSASGASSWSMPSFPELPVRNPSGAFWLAAVLVLAFFYMGAGKDSKAQGKIWTALGKIGIVALVILGIRAFSPETWGTIRSHVNDKTVSEWLRSPGTSASASVGAVKSNCPTVSAGGVADFAHANCYTLVLGDSPISVRIPRDRRPFRTTSVGGYCSYVSHRELPKPVPAGDCVQDQPEFDDLDFRHPERKMAEYFVIGRGQVKWYR